LGICAQLAAAAKREVNLPGLNLDDLAPAKSIAPIKQNTNVHIALDREKLKHQSKPQLSLH
jgi:hypothetical protein